jgi:hypothetical protein
MNTLVIGVIINVILRYIYIKMSKSIFISTCGSNLCMNKNFYDFNLQFYLLLLYKIENNKCSSFMLCFVSVEIVILY